jgi:hypothetical protein
MSAEISLGAMVLAATAPSFANPPAAKVDLALLLAGRLLVQGNSGAGKSWLLRRLLEEAHGKVQQVVIDPDGEFATLADEFDYAVLPYGEIDRIGGAAVALHLRQHGYSAVLDLSDCDDEDRMRVVADFATGLIEAPRELWRPLIVAIDEAQILAPRTNPGDVDADTLHRVVKALADVSGRGRKRGLAGVVATHRISETATAVVSKATNYIIGRTVFDRDLARAAGHLGLTIGKAGAIRNFPDGEFTAIGPAFGPRRIRFKVGATKTRHVGKTPELGTTPAIGAKAARAMLSEMPDSARESSIPSGAPVASSSARKGRPSTWTAEQDAIIVAGYGARKRLVEIIGELADAGFRRSAAGISTRAQVLGVTTARDMTWKPEEDEIVIAAYRRDDRIADIVTLLSGAGFDRSRNSVQMRAIALGISGDRVNYWTEPEIAIARAGLESGKRHSDILEELRVAGFHRGVAALSKFAAARGFAKPIANPWTDEQVAILRARYAAGISPREVATELGRDYVSIVSKASVLGISVKKDWPLEDRQKLVDGHAAGKKLIEIVAEIGRPYQNVAKIAEKMGLSFKAGPRPQHMNGHGHA